MLTKLVSGFGSLATYRSAVAAALLMAMVYPAAAVEEYRPIWVDVFHPGLRSQPEADAMLDTIRDAGYNAVIIQVRKACDAYYNSRVEPKNPAVKAGFDPLQHILDRAHSTASGKPRMEVHAWLVMYRTRLPGDNLWRDPNHIFQKHPEWMSEDVRGRKVDSGESPGRYYLDPGVPGVVDYNLNVVRDILSRYDVDGIHFDYIRYPESEGGGNNWGYNPIALSRFNALYKRSGKPEPDDPQFNEFRRRQISDQVRKIYTHVRAWRPRVKVSAATITWGDVDRGFEQSPSYKQVFQDWPRMANDGFLDLIIPMNYKREHVRAQARAHRTWAQFTGQVAEKSGRFGINSADGEELNSLDGILAQIGDTRHLPGISGIATYCYAEPRTGSAKRSTPDLEFFSAIRSRAFASTATIPEATWLTRPREGLIKGIVTRNGRPVDGATVRIGNRSALSDGTGFYAFARVAPGQQQLRAEDGSGALGAKSVAVQAGAVAEAPLGN